MTIKTTETELLQSSVSSLQPQMSRVVGVVSFVIGWLLCSCAVMQAADPTRREPGRVAGVGAQRIPGNHETVASLRSSHGHPASPLQDDANLYDVQFLGTQTGWAVGDHGVVWTTRDGGANWQFVKTPVDCALRSVCFLTDRVGWIVGGGTTPYSRVGYGVVLATSDGGRTWQLTAGAALPPLQYVKFYDLQTGVAVGEASPDHPAGVMTTADGGKTWQALEGKRSPGWRTAAFTRNRIGTEIGVTAGLRGRISLAGSERLLPARIDSLGLQTVRDVSLEPDESGWLVGDGGLVLQTTNRGFVWKQPPQPLPADLRDIVNFHAVASRGDRVWIAGQPGSVIWHSPDRGRSWIKQYTRQPTPIHRIAFSSDSAGCAVGALGLILQTSDGGRTWQARRGGGRRIALMAVHAHPDRVSFSLLAKQSADLGYRSAVLLPVRRDVGPDGHDQLDLDLRLHDAVTAVGGSAGEIDWRFPITRPGLDSNAEKLLEDWDRRTEGRLRDVMLGGLVAQLRTWRPSVLVIDEPPEWRFVPAAAGSAGDPTKTAADRLRAKPPARRPGDDATSHLLNDALLRAAKQAADPTYFIEQHDLAGLEPWRISRIYVRLPAGSTGNTHIDAHEYLPRLQSTVQMAAAAAEARLIERTRPRAPRESYRLVVDGERRAESGERDGPATRHSPLATRHSPVAGDFFASTPMLPGSEARRHLLPLSKNHDVQEQLARRQRNFQAAAEKFLDDDRFAGQLIAQLREASAGMPREQAALQLAELAGAYRRRNQWELMESTLVELIGRYPTEPVALEAMRWLFQFWVAVEPAWQRTRHAGVVTKSRDVDRTSIRTAIQQAVHQAQIEPEHGGAVSIDPDPITILDEPGQLKIDRNQDWRSGAVRHWQEQALKLASIIRKRSPALYGSPEIQFPLASLLRQRGISHMLGRSYLRYHESGSDDPWKHTADAEQWLTNPLDIPPKKAVACRYAGERPHLDAVLSDRCWQDAEEIRLTTAETPAATTPGGGYAFAMISYDAEYLYFAASVPRAADAPGDVPQREGRTHDADLSRFDRLGFFFDVDRDYVTYYSLEVDQRGWTSDTCWEDRSWNPKWHVAAEGDAERWRIEVAIPFEELVPSPPQKNSTWAVGIVRTIPTVGFESWTHPAASRPRPETFGLVRFD